MSDELRLAEMYARNEASMEYGDDGPMSLYTAEYDRRGAELEAADYLIDRLCAATGVTPGPHRVKDSVARAKLMKALIKHIDGGPDDR